MTFYALEEPLLRAALAACAGCLVSLHLHNDADERLNYYNAAAQMLSDTLTTIQRDASLCATAALIIEVVEMLVLGPIESGMRIRAVNTARSLITECGWNTRTQGLGGACSWLSIVMELLDCISFQHMIAWDPDTWGVDINFTVQPSVTGNEELWTQRIIYICAKVSDLRSSLITQGLSKSTRNAEAQRLQQWSLYNGWCDKWFASVPRSMLPLGQVQPWQRNPQSAFPQVWLIERPAIVAQMLYHVTRILLAGTDPLRQDRLAEQQQEQQHHAYNVCGIVSNDKNCGMPIFSAQILAIAAGHLVDRKAQAEVLTILDEMRRTTGLNTDHLKHKLEETWDWHSHNGQQLLSALEATTLPFEFHTHEPGHEYSHIGIADPFSHTLTDAHPFLDHHLTYDQS